MNKKVFVCGDIGIDEIIVDEVRLSNTLVYNETINIYRIGASAKLLHKIIKNHSGELIDDELIDSDDSEGKSKPEFETISKWSKKTKDNNKPGFFLNEYIGVKYNEESEYNKNLEKIEESISGKKIVAVCDVYNRNRGFCDLLERFDEWIVVRTLPQNEGTTNLLDKLKGNTHKKTIVILNSSDLRKAGFKITKGVSWEQLIIETRKALSKDPWSKLSYLVVCFEHEGVMIFNNINKEYIALFYPNEIEGDHLRRNDKVYGILTTFQAFIVIHLCNMDDDNKIISVLVDASKAGIIAMRNLIERGFNERCEYPFDIIPKDIKESEETSENKKIVTLHLEEIDSNMIILELLNKKDINSLCEDIINNGVKNAFKETPVLEYGNFLSADRFEIEDYRRIHNLFEEYLLNQKMNKPLSVCVFGAPGSGKSFGINEIVRHFRNERNFRIQTCIFNLSQFNLDDLSFAFDQVRDISLNDKVPIVFWDEFDCEVNGQPLGWLKRFLAPMQDGEYYENANRHSIGRAIFIFAGGVYNSSKEIEDDINNKKEYKLPDFWSRIDGSLNIRGLNEIKDAAAQHEDKFHKVRRAIIIRKQIEKYLHMSENEKMPEHISEYIKNKLLNRNTYEHGVRTLEFEIKKNLS